MVALLRSPSAAVAQTPPPTPTPQATPTTTPTPEPTPQATPSPAPTAPSNALNPDTSVIANFVGAAGKNGGPERSLQLSEVELSFRAVVDPYARADFFLAATPDGLEVEEGFITFTTLPKSLLLKVGKMRAQFGKVNTLHTHAMPTADRPLVTQNLVGGEEGISDSGVSLSKLFDNPLVFLEATAEVYSGDSEVFQSDSRSRLNYVGRLRAYRDLSESANLDVGGSIAWGPTDQVGPDANRRLIGVDATFRYRPLRRAIYSRFNARTELIWSRQDLLDEPAAKAFGMYALAEYQFARRWYLGARWDRSDRALEALRDTGGSAFLTFWPSEFTQIRGQYRHTRYGDGRRANEFLFQLNFGIGAHGAHAF